MRKVWAQDRCVVVYNHLTGYDTIMIPWALWLMGAGAGNFLYRIELFFLLPAIQFWSNVGGHFPIIRPSPSGTGSSSSSSEVVVIVGSVSRG